MGQSGKSSVKSKHKQASDQWAMGMRRARRRGVGRRSSTVVRGRKEEPERADRGMKWKRWAAGKSAKSFVRSSAVGEHAKPAQVGAEREAEREAGTTETEAPLREDESLQKDESLLSIIPTNEKAHLVETLLIQNIVRHGEEIIFDNVETEDGMTIRLSVSQYIHYDLQQDKLCFSQPLYNRILSEAVEHNNEEGFKAEHYFSHHPDVEISRLANQLIFNRYQLSKSLQMEHKPASLKQYTRHLILDFRLNIIEQRMKEIQEQLQQLGSDMEQIRSLMEEYRDTQQLRDVLARQIGSDIIATRR